MSCSARLLHGIAAAPSLLRRARFSRPMAAPLPPREQMSGWVAQFQLRGFGGKHSGETEDALLAAAASLAASGIGPEGVDAFSSSTIPCNLRCNIKGLSGEEANMVADLLLSFGAQSTSVAEERNEDRPEQEIFGAAPKELWDHCTLSALFPLKHDIPGTLDQVKDILGKESIQYSVEQVLDEEWEAAIKASYVPFEVQSDLWVVPEWCEIPDPDAINIILAPGLAFGTGEHPTTRLCLNAIHDKLQGGESVMDYGTGSGVLGIGAMKLGASRAVGTDIDPFSITAATQNAALNGLEEQFDLFLCGADMSEPDPLEQGGYDLLEFDVVVANILRGPLVELRPRLLSYLKPGGRLILSGITSEQAELISNEYSPYIGAIEMEELGGWMVVTGLKKAEST